MEYPYGDRSNPDGSRDEWQYPPYTPPEPTDYNVPTIAGWSTSPPDPTTSGQYWPYPPAIPLAQPRTSSPYPATGQPAVRMPRAEALSVAGRLKRWVAAGAILGFGVLAGLAAGHSTGVTASQSQGSPAVAPSNPSSQPSSGGFFNSDDSGNSGNSGNSGGGTYFGPGTSSQAPVSGSSAS